MNSGWTKTTLGGLCDSGQAMIQTGPFGSQLHSYDYRPTGVPVIPTEAIRRRRISDASVPRVPEEIAIRLSRHALKAGDILFARRGAQATGLSAIVEPRHEGWLCGTGAILLRLHTSDVDATFLSFALSSEATISWLKAHAVGAVMPNLNEGVLRRLPLLLPSPPNQRAIARMLRVLDDKIELNRQMNDTLEAMSKTLFNSWFVQTTQDGLPEGWGEASIYEAADVVYGAPFSSAHFNTERTGKPLIRIRDLADEDPEVFTSEEHPKGYLVKPGDIVVGMDGEFRAHLWGGEEGWLNQRVCVFAPKAGFSNVFVLNSIATQLAEVEATETATTVIHLGKSDIDRFSIVRPPETMLRRFNDVCEPLYERIVFNKRASRTLAALREALLPKLLSGQIRVKEFR